MANYYVDCVSGSDTNLGTLAFPFKTIAKANTMPNPGDFILLKCGTNIPEQLAPTRSGVQGGMITYGRYGVGPNPIVQKSATCAFYIADDLHHLRFEHIDFSGSSGSYSSIYCYDAHDIEFFDCVGRDALSRHGLSVNSVNHPVYNISFDSCVLRDNYMSGTYTGTLTSNNVLFKNCVAHTNGHSTSGDHGFYVAGGVTIDNCLAYNNAGAGFKMNDNEKEPFLYPVVKNSEAYGNNYGIVFTHKNALAFNNHIHDNNYNIIYYGNAWGGYKCYFNTLINGKTTNARAGMWFGAGLSANSDIRNNLIIQDMSVVTRGAIHFDVGISMTYMESAFDYNVYYTNGLVASTVFLYQGSNSTTKSWNGWLSAGAEPHGIFLNVLPDFYNRYTDVHPITGGNLQGKGIAIPGYELDKDGKQRLATPTPGCFEVVTPPVNQNADEIEKLILILANLSETEIIVSAKSESINQSKVRINSDISSLTQVSIDLAITYEELQLELAAIRGAITDIQDTIDSLSIWQFS